MPVTNYDDALDTIRRVVLQTLVHYQRGETIPADVETLDQLSRAVVQEIQHSNCRWTLGVLANRWAEVKPDYRIGLSCKPKYRSHELYYERGKIIETHPDGTGGLSDKDGILRIQMESGKTFLARADDWQTA